MGETTPIEWTDATFNPWWGCAKVSPGCDHCYAEGIARRFHDGIWGAGLDTARRVFDHKHWAKPLGWNKRAAESGKRMRVFCASMADVFDNHPGVTDEREKLWTLIHKTPSLDWQLLTKRIGNVKRMVPPSWLTGHWPAHAWLGISVVNQEEADRDIPKLLELPSRIHFLSCEPLLGRIDISEAIHLGRCKSIGPKPDLFRCGLPEGHDDEHTALMPTGAPWFGKTALAWVIVGGESGRDARPMHPDWARSIRDQCKAAGVPFLFKQWGEWRDIEDGQACRVCGCTWNFACPGGCSWIETDLCSACKGLPTPAQPPTRYRRVGKHVAGRFLDGRTWDEYPEARQ
jgi:protein gp37